MTRKVEAAGTADERITEYTYDSYGNQLTVKRVGDANTAEAITNMAYDETGNMTSVTDPAGNITQFTHDNMGNVLTKEDARNKVWTYEYDAAGKLKSITDPYLNYFKRFTFLKFGMMDFSAIAGILFLLCSQNPLKNCTLIKVN